MAGFVVGPEARSAAPEDGQTPPAEYWTLSGNVKGPLAKNQTEALAEQDMAMIADPIPLGLAGFASATFTLSAAVAWWSPVSYAAAIPTLLIFGGIGQFLAGMWAYRRGNTIAATAFGTFGSFNTAYAVLLLLTAVTHALPALGVYSEFNYVAGIFVMTFGLVSAYLGIAALGDNYMIAAILFVLALTYFADGSGMWITGHNWVLSIGGYLGMLVSLMAFYESAAIAINSGLKREALPAFAVKKGPHSRGASRMPSTGLN